MLLPHLPIDAAFAVYGTTGLPEDQTGIGFRVGYDVGGLTERGSGWGANTKVGIAARLRSWTDQGLEVSGRAPEGAGKPAVRADEVLLYDGSTVVCSAATRGTIIYDAGGSGQADRIRSCLKNANGVYALRTLQW